MRFFLSSMFRCCLEHNATKLIFIPDATKSLFTSMMSFHGHHHGHEHRPGPAQQRGHQSLDKWRMFILATPESETRTSDNTVCGHDKLVMTDASVLHNLDKSTLRTHPIQWCVSWVTPHHTEDTIYTTYDICGVSFTGYAKISWIPLHIMSDNGSYNELIRHSSSSSIDPLTSFSCSSKSRLDQHRKQIPPRAFKISSTPHSLQIPDISII